MLLLAEACCYGQWKANLLELRLSDGRVGFGAKLVGVCHGETLSSHHQSFLQLQDVGCWMFVFLCCERCVLWSADNAPVCIK